MPAGLAALGRAVDDLVVPPGGTALAALLRLRDRLDACVTEAVAAFDATDGWASEGATSMTAWLADRGGASRRRSAALASTARSLARLPATAAAWRSGALSSGQVEAIAANVSSTTVDVFADHEAALLPALVPLSAGEVATTMRVWRERATAEADLPADSPARSLHLSRSFGGRWQCDGSFDAEAGELVATALRVAEGRDDDGERRRSPGERRADGLVDLCRAFLDRGRSGTSGRHRPHISVIVPLEALVPGSGAGPVGGNHAASVTGASAPPGVADPTRPANAGPPDVTDARGPCGGADPAGTCGGADPAGTCGGTNPAGAAGDAGAANANGAASAAGAARAARAVDSPGDPGLAGVGETVSGTVLSARAVGRLACDCTLHRLLVDERRGVLDYGRVTRTVPAPLWNALVARDRHCRFPGCDRPPTWCEAHHVVPWQRGGATSLANLVLLCSRHHHLLHGGDWHADLAADGTFAVTDPTDRRRTTEPPLRRQHPPPLARAG
jgi:hypothetical protein